MIAGDPRNSLVLSIAIRNSLMELFIESRIRLQPKEKVKLDDYVVLCDSDCGSIDRLSDVLRREALREGTDERRERGRRS